MRKIEICVYCGQRPGSTRDHVPPRSIFVKPYPKNMSTVPACLECNAKFGKDIDENLKIYLFQFLMGEDEPSSHVMNFIRSVAHTLNSNGKLQKSFEESLILPLNPTYKQALIKINPHERKNHIDNALKRMAYGLYFLFYNSILPLDAKIEIFDLTKIPILSIFNKINGNPKKYSVDDDIFFVLYEKFQDGLIFELFFYKTYVTRTVITFKTKS